MSSQLNYVVSQSSQQHDHIETMDVPAFVLWDPGLCLFQRGVKGYSPMKSSTYFKE